MTISILVGDVFERLRGLPGDSFDCVVTSPPYWGLRKYLPAGSPEEKFEIGLEPTMGEHIAVMVDVFREVRRVLKPSGTLWLNYGDCYATSPNGRSAADTKATGNDDRTFRDKPFSTIGPVYDPEGGAKGGGYRGSNKGNSGGAAPGRVVSGGYLKAKDLCMIPNRLAIALQDDGWWVRSEIIWNKTNPKPESVFDRPAAVHEKVWLLTKSENYYFNAEALKEPVTGGAHARRKDGQYKPAKGSTAGQNREGTWVETYVPELRNGRNVWTFNIEGFRGAHFATFPRELARRCLAAGAPPTVCACCGAAEGCGPICEVYGRAPTRVLDPFGGSGTTALVASSLGLDTTLIELNPEYAEIARIRLSAPVEDVA